MRRPINRSSSSSPSPARVPKARPAGYVPPRLSQLKAAPPVSGKQRRRQMKAAAWRLSKIIHAPARKIISTLAEDRAAAAMFANKTPDRRGDAMRLANKVARLARKAK
jgi:hypothetical protein